MTMTFKEALIAHLQGNDVQVCGSEGNWKAFDTWFNQLFLNEIMDRGFGGALQYRLAPRTVMCNGVEVPAPESVAPNVGDVVWIADPCGKAYMCYPETWSNHPEQLELLSRSLVHKAKEDAISRAKAMLITG